jgi:ribosomal protein S27AE
MSNCIQYEPTDTRHLFPTNGKVCVKCGKSRFIAEHDGTFCDGVPISVVDMATAERSVKYKVYGEGKLMPPALLDHGHHF